MRFLRNTLVLVILAFGVSACPAPTYHDPEIKTENDSNMAILKNRWSPCPFCIRKIQRNNGDEIPVTKEDSIFIKTFEEFRLAPGEYRISYADKGYKMPYVSDTASLYLKAGHVYEVKQDWCIAIFGSTCSSGLRSYTEDIWIEDLTTGEWIAGCRQGKGCRGE